MNKTEKKAFEWLLNKGIPKEAIVFQVAKSPDFIFTDRNIKYEVKRSYGKKVLLRRPQFALLKKMTNVHIAVFSDDSKEPIAIIPIADVEEGMEHAQGLILHWVPTGNEVTTGVSVTLEKEQLEWLKDGVKEGTFANISHGVRYALKQLMKRTSEKSA